jgi:hypothetical protein
MALRSTARAAKSKVVDTKKAVTTVAGKKTAGKGPIKPSGKSPAGTGTNTQAGKKDEKANSRQSAINAALRKPEAKLKDKEKGTSSDKTSTVAPGKENGTLKKEGVAGENIELFSESSTASQVSAAPAPPAGDTGKGASEEFADD